MMFDIRAESASTARLYSDLPPQSHGFLAAPEAWVYAQPRSDAAILSQYTRGEPLQLLQRHEDWLQVQSLLDHYIGWIRAEAFQRGEALPSHRSIAACVLLARPDLKAPVLEVWPQDAYFRAEAFENEHVFTGSGWLDLRQVEALTPPQRPLEALRQALESQLQRSYIWGGRGLAGLDCSALAQYAYRRAGCSIPRDSDLQKMYLQKYGRAVAEEALQLGDLIFIPGHVMVALNAKEIIHASGFHLRVVRESWAEARARYAAQMPDLQPACFRYLP